MKKIWILGGIGICSLLGGCAIRRSPPPVPLAAPPNFTSTITQIKQSVVPVVCIHLPASGVETTLTSVEGTAFFIQADGTFATAGHVVRGLTAPNRPIPCERAAIYMPVGGWQPTAVNFRVQYFHFAPANCTRDDTLDLAICRAPRNIKEIMGSDPRPVELETALQPDGTPAAFTGFPLQYIVPITSRGFVATYRDARDELGPREFLIDKPNWPGASGSPICLENGKVIGIILQRGIGDALGITVGMPASFIERVLAQRRQNQ